MSVLRFNQKERFSPLLLLYLVSCTCIPRDVAANIVSALRKIVLSENTNCIVEKIKTFDPT